MSLHEGVFDKVPLEPLTGPNIMLGGRRRLSSFEGRNSKDLSILCKFGKAFKSCLNSHE